MIFAMSLFCAYLWLLGGFLLGGLYYRDMKELAGAIVLFFFWPILVPISLLGAEFIRWRGSVE